MTRRPRQRAARSLWSVLYTVALFLPAVLVAQPGEREPEQSHSTDERRQASVVQADRLIDRVIDGEPVTDLLGNVYIDRDTVTARSDSARYWRSQEVYEMWGRVRVRQLETVLSCERAVYRQLEAAADFDGSVRVEEGEVIGTAARGESRDGGRLLRLIGAARLVSPEYTVWADSITRDRVTGQSEASGHVKIVDPAAQTLVTGDHAVFSADGGSARVDRNPSLISREQGELPFESWAEVMHFYQAEERIVMVDSVQIRQGLTEAAADTAVFLGRETLILRGHPRVWVGEQNTMTGHEIEFRYRNQQLSRIIMRGAARMEDTAPESLAAIFSGLPSMDILEGDTITVEIDKNQVERSVVVGNAHSLYVPTDLADEVAFNDVYGDTIILHFRNQKVDRVDVAGNMTGSYSYARLEQMTEERPLFGAALQDSLADPTAALPDSAVAVVDSAVVVTITAEADTLETAAARSDSLTVSARSKRFDFLGSAEKVVYSGHSVDFFLAERTIDIERDASLTYDTMTLTAQKVRFDTVQRELYAEGEPLLVDAEQKVVGEEMGYNFEHKTGAVRDGVTAFEGRYYAGREIRRFDDGSMKIHSGYMTSCDLAVPHYHFWSDKMKLNLDDKMVAKPVVMYIGKVPVFGLPFYFKSMKTGRRSGILFPNFNFGWSQRTGRYIRDFGYYWATNDYLDFMFQADFNERRDTNLRVVNRYVKRYSFRGGFQYTWRTTLGDQTTQTREWQFRWNHDQEHLFDVYTLRANVHTSSTTLSSNDLSRDIGRDVISGQLRSSLTLSRRWSFMNANLSLSRDQRVNAEDDDLTTDNVLYTQIMPQLALGFQRVPLRGQLQTGQKGSFLGDLQRNTYFNQSYNMKISQQKRELTKGTTYNGSGSWSLDIRPPRLSIFNLSAGARASQNWTLTKESGQLYVRTDSSYVDPDSTLVLEDVFEPFSGQTEDTRPSLSFNTSLGTTLYGVFPLPLGRLRAFRHTFRFSANYAWRPSLGSKQLQNESVGFSIGNRFDLKYLSGSPSDSTAETKKLDGVLDWSLGFSYDPARTLMWSPISSNITIRPGQGRNLNMKVGNTVDPYRWKVVDTRVTYGFNIAGRFDTGGEVKDAELELNDAIDRLGIVPDSTATVEGVVPEGEEFEDFVGGGQELFAGFERDSRDPLGGPDRSEGGRFIPWTLNGSFSLSRNHDTDVSTVRSNLSLSAQLTRNWDFRYRASFDLVQGRTTRQEWSLHRNLHCWRLEFSRIVSDVDPQYGFRIYLVDIPSIKLNQGNEQLLGSLGGGMGGLY